MLILTDNLIIDQEDSMSSSLPSRDECIVAIKVLERIEKDLEDDQRVLDILDADDLEKLAKVSALVVLLLDLREEPSPAV